MEKQMLISLKSIQKRYNDIQNKILLPEVTNNIKKYTKFLKEANEIKDIVETFEQYQLWLEKTKQAQEILRLEKNKEIIDLAKIEIEETQHQTELLEKKIKILLIPKDPNDNKNVIMEIRGAAGGNEANIFAGNLFDIYKKWSISNNMKISLINLQKSNTGGYSQIIFKIEGQKVYSKLKFESGVHRVQRIPTTETQGRVHTSTATIIVMPEIDDSVTIDINSSDLKIDTYRSSGAGGQSVNTTDSAVRITHIPTGIVVTSQDERSQLQNKETCIKIIKTKLYDLEIQKQQDQDSAFRALGGSGARSEKVRTYNYPQDRVTDHRIHLSLSLKLVLDGKINNIIETLQAKEEANRIKGSNLK